MPGSLRQGTRVWSSCNVGHCKGQGDVEHNKPLPRSLPPRVTAPVPKSPVAVEATVPWAPCPPTAPLTAVRAAAVPALPGLGGIFQGGAALVGPTAATGAADQESPGSGESNGTRCHQRSPSCGPRAPALCRAQLYPAPVLAAGAELPGRTLRHAWLSIPGNLHPCPSEETKASCPHWGCGFRGHRHSPCPLFLVAAQRAQALVGVTGALPEHQVEERALLLPGSIPVGRGEHSAPGTWGTPRRHPGGPEGISWRIAEGKGGSGEGTDLSGILMPKRNISAWKAVMSRHRGHRK